MSDENGCSTRLISSLFCFKKVLSDRLKTMPLRKGNMHTVQTDLVLWVLLVFFRQNINASKGMSVLVSAIKLPARCY